jgi:hypothetical protein
MPLPLLSLPAIPPAPKPVLAEDAQDGEVDEHVDADTAIYYKNVDQLRDHVRDYDQLAIFAPTVTQNRYANDHVSLLFDVKHTNDGKVQGLTLSARVDDASEDDNPPPDPSPKDAIYTVEPGYAKSMPVCVSLSLEEATNQDAVFPMETFPRNINSSAFYVGSLFFEVDDTDDCNTRPVLGDNKGETILSLFEFVAVAENVPFLTLKDASTLRTIEGPTTDLRLDWLGRCTHGATYYERRGFVREQLTEPKLSVQQIANQMSVFGAIVKAPLDGQLEFETPFLQWMIIQLGFADTTVSQDVWERGQALLEDLQAILSDEKAIYMDLKFIDWVLLVNRQAEPSDSVWIYRRILQLFTKLKHPSVSAFALKCGDLRKDVATRENYLGVFDKYDLDTDMESDQSNRLLGEPTLGQTLDIVLNLVLETLSSSVAVAFDLQYFVNTSDSDLCTRYTGTDTKRVAAYNELTINDLHTQSQETRNAIDFLIEVASGSNSSRWEYVHTPTSKIQTPVQRQREVSITEYAYADRLDYDSADSDIDENEMLVARKRVRISVVYGPRSLETVCASGSLREL